MDRNTALTVALAVLAVLALAVAAATLDTAERHGGQTGEFGSGSNPEEAGAGDDSGAFAFAESAADRQGSPIRLCLEFLRTVEAFVLAGVAVLVLFAVVSWRTESYAVGAAFVVSLLMPAALVWLVLTSCAPVGSPFARVAEATNSSVLTTGGGSSGAEGEAARSLTSPSSLLAILLLVALAGSVVLLFVSTGDDEPVPEEDVEEPADRVDVAAVGRAAGRAATRIEADGDVDNEVYRAWVEMTEHLDVDNPRSSTPAEFAAAAVDAGMDRGEVEALTGLFEAVRYGGEEPTPDRERRAVEALRRIEDSYAGPESGDAPGIDPDPDPDGNPDTDPGEQP